MPMGINCQALARLFDPMWFSPLLIVSTNQHHLFLSFCNNQQFLSRVPNSQNLTLESILDVYAGVHDKSTISLETGNVSFPAVRVKVSKIIKVT